MYRHYIRNTAPVGSPKSDASQQFAEEVESLKEESSDSPSLPAPMNTAEPSTYSAIENVANIDPLQLQSSHVSSMHCNATSTNVLKDTEQEKHQDSQSCNEEREWKEKTASCKSDTETDSSSSQQSSRERTPPKKKCTKRSPKKSSKKSSHKRREEIQTPLKKSEKKKTTPKAVTPRKNEKQGTRKKYQDSSAELEKRKHSPDERKGKSPERKKNSKGTKNRSRDSSVELKKRIQDCDSDKRKAKSPERKRTDISSKRYERQKENRRSSAHGYSPKRVEVKERIPRTFSRAMRYRFSKQDVDEWRKDSALNLARTLFVCNLGPNIRSETLKKYFEKFGIVLDATVMENQPRTIVFRSRGFGFVKFLTQQGVENVQTARPHFLNGCSIVTKRTLPLKDHYIHLACEQTPVMKVKGLGGKISREELDSHFSHYGNITFIEMSEDKTWAKITFDDYDPVDKVLMQPYHRMFGRSINVHKCRNHELNSEIAPLKTYNSPSSTAAVNAKKKKPEEMELQMAATPNNICSESFNENRRSEFLKPTHQPKTTPQKQANSNRSVCGTYTVQEVCLRCFDCGCRDEVIAGCPTCLKKHLSMLCDDQQVSPSTNFKIQVPATKTSSETPILASYITSNNNTPIENCKPIHSLFDRNFTPPSYGQQVPYAKKIDMCTNTSPQVMTDNYRNEEVNVEFQRGRYNSQTSSDSQFMNFLSPDNNSNVFYLNNMQGTHPLFNNNEMRRQSTFDERFQRQLSISPPPPPCITNDFNLEATDFLNRERYHIRSPLMFYGRERSPFSDYRRHNQSSPPSLIVNTCEPSPIRPERSLSPYRHVILDPRDRCLSRNRSPVKGKSCLGERSRPRCRSSQMRSPVRRRNPSKVRSPVRRRSSPQVRSPVRRRSLVRRRSSQQGRSPLKERSPVRHRSPPRELRGHCKRSLSPYYRRTTEEEYTRSNQQEQFEVMNNRGHFFSLSSSESDVSSKRRKVFHSQLDGRLDKLLESCRRESIKDPEQNHVEEMRSNPKPSTHHRGNVSPLQHPSKDVVSTSPVNDNMKQKLEAVIQVCALLLKEHDPATHAAAAPTGPACNVKIPK